jgi:peptide/nickel transport system permease protein
MSAPVDTGSSAPASIEAGAVAPGRVSYGRYAVRQIGYRLVQLLILVFGISTLLFFLLRLTGDPALVLVGDLASPEQVEQVRAFYGLDRSIFVQYFLFLGQAVQLNFGTSLLSFRNALDVVLDALPATMVLAAAAIALNLVVALLVGTWLGYRPERPERRIGLVAVLVSQGIPGFVVGLILIQLLAVKWRLLPSIGLHGVSSLILPTVTLASFLLPRVIRLTATNVDEAMRQDYVRTARASGAPPGAVLWRHVLPNAVIGTVALVGVQFGFLLSGSLITESLFAWPGIGLVLIEAVRGLDFPVVQASVAVVAVLVFAINMITDLSFPLLDPRLRAERV